MTVSPGIRIKFPDSSWSFTFNTDTDFSYDNTVKWGDINVTNTYDDSGLTTPTSGGEASGSTIYIKVPTAAEAIQYGIGDQLILWDSGTGIGTHLRCRVTAASVQNGANSYITALTLENDTSSILNAGADMSSLIHVLDMPHELASVDLLLMSTSSDLYVSSNDTYDGSPTDSFQLLADRPVVYVPNYFHSGLYNNPFSSGDVETVFLMNRSSTTNATVKIRLMQKKSHE